jgi:transcriptional regulator with XRE-family HTH domain
MFYELLKTFRIQAGLSQLQLAKAVKMNPSHLNRLERGLRNPPRREKVLLLADVLGLGEEEKKTFMLEAGYSPPNQLKEKSPIVTRGYTAILPGEGLEAIEEAQTLPELVREILKDQALTPLQRRQMALQIRYFTLWLHNTMKSPSSNDMSTERKRR